MHYDFDWLVIGSGFGGSVSALRLAQKGYKVGVIECGRRFADDELPKSTWDVRRYWYAPRLGLNGIFRLTIFKDVAIASGSGVGGGSLGYANTLYRAPARFYEDPQWAGLNDWQVALAPHYEEAERMLGVATYDEDDPADDFLREYAEEIGVGGTYAKTRVGVFLGEAGKTVPDPFFGGEGPDRTGCLRCGRCMVGCPHGAKNTLVKNYLWFAERAGVKVMPERTVVDIKPLGALDGSDGYAVTTRALGRVVPARPAHADGARRGRRRGRARARTGCSPPAGSTARCRSISPPPRRAGAHELGGDPRGHAPRRARPTSRAGSRSPARSTPNPRHAHRDRRLRRRGRRRLRAVHAADRRRHADHAAAEARRRGDAAPGAARPKTLNPRGWSKRTIIVLVMQSLDNAISLRARPGRGGRVRLSTEQDPERPNPTFIPVANEFAEWLAKRTGGIAQSSIMEAAANIPTHRPHPRRGGDRRGPVGTASSTPASGSSATRTCSSATAPRSPPTSASTRA